MAASLVQIALCFHLITPVYSQNCLQTGNEIGLPSFDYGFKIEDRITLGHQAIIPSYKFVCDQMCGNITEWGVDVHRGGGMDQNEYTFDLQVWRPSPTVNDSTGTGCYSLIGNNRFTSISLSFSVAEVTPSPQDHIQFRPGDVLGFYVEEARRDTDGVVVLTSPSSFTSELVWYASIAPTMTTYSVGSNGVLNTMTRAAPVISIETVTYPCPSVVAPTPLPTTQVATTTTDRNTIPHSTTQQPQEETTDGNTTPSPTTQEATDPNTTPPQQPEEEASSTQLDLPTMLTEATSNEAAPLTNPLRPPEPSDTLSMQSTSTLPSGTEQPVTSDSEPTVDRVTGSNQVGLVAGIVVVILVVVTITIVLILVIVIVLRKHNTSKQKGRTNMTRHTEGSTYAYPAVDLTEVKWNEAYATNIVTEGNEAYATTNVVTEWNEAYANVVVEENEAYYATTNIVTGENEAYATNIITKESEAYSASIVPERNEAYRAVNTVTVSETADMYDYVKP